MYNEPDRQLPDRAAVNDNQRITRRWLGPQRVGDGVRRSAIATELSGAM